MSDLFSFIIIGLSTGAVYGLAGTGLVLTYKTSGIFNFAHGSVATLAVFLFYFLWQEHGWPWPVAAVVAVFGLGPLLGLALELVARILANASDIFKIAAMIGLVVGVLAIGSIWYGSNGKLVPSYLPTGSVQIFGASLGWNELTVIIVSLVATSALYYLFRYVRLGASMRAVVDDPVLISMTGDDPVRIRRWAWVIGTTFAALSGVLLAPGLSLSALILTELVVQAFGAAAIGAFSSLPLTYIGGLVLGVLGAVSTKYVGQFPNLAGLPASLPFIILFIALIVTPRARLAARRYVPTVSQAKPYYAPTGVRILFGAAVVVALCFVPNLVGTYLPAYSQALIDVVLFISLGLLVRLSGQVSLCQYAFVAVGAAAMGHFTSSFGLPWLLAVALAGLIAIPIGAIIAIPATRLSGVFLALATLGFGILLQQMFYSTSFMFTQFQLGIPAARPDVSIGGLNLQTDRGFYYVLLVFAVAAAITMVLIMRSRLGRILGAVSDSPLALETLGVNVNVSKVLVFCLSAFVAAIAGALSASSLHFATGTQYPPFSSLTIVALVVIIPFGVPWFAVMAAAGLDLLPAYIHLGGITNYIQILFGVSALLAAVTLRHHHGAPAQVRRLADAINAALPSLRHKPREPEPVERAIRGGGLEVVDLGIRYGGTVALKDLTLTAPTGKVTGLVGPNGAGKTSSFNAICGIIRTTSGEICLHGQNISRLSPSERARRGLGRTFQRVELFNSLSVQENVALGYEGGLAGRNPLTQLLSRRAQADVIAAATEEALEATGITDLRDREAAGLSTGQRRMVELARVLAGRFDMILLDEPGSGLDSTEKEVLAATIQRVVRERGIGMLLVEHDMGLVRQVCDDVWVLDFGETIFSGTTTDMLESEAVKLAYLGSEESPLPPNPVPSPGGPEKSPPPPNPVPSLGGPAPESKNI